MFILSISILNIQSFLKSSVIVLKFLNTIFLFSYSLILGSLIFLISSSIFLSNSSFISFKLIFILGFSFFLIIKELLTISELLLTMLIVVLQSVENDFSCSRNVLLLFSKTEFSIFSFWSFNVFKLILEVFLFSKLINLGF